MSRTLNEVARALWIERSLPASMNFVLLVTPEGWAYVDGKRVGWYCSRCGGVA